MRCGRRNSRVHPSNVHQLRLPSRAFASCSGRPLCVGFCVINACKLRCLIQFDSTPQRLDEFAGVDINVEIQLHVLQKHVVEHDTNLLSAFSIPLWQRGMALLRLLTTVLWMVGRWRQLSNGAPKLLSCRTSRGSRTSPWAAGVAPSLRLLCLLSLLHHFIPHPHLMRGFLSGHCRSRWQGGCEKPFILQTTYGPLRHFNVISSSHSMVEAFSSIPGTLHRA